MNLSDLNFLIKQTNTGKTFLKTFTVPAYTLYMCITCKNNCNVTVFVNFSIFKKKIIFVVHLGLWGRREEVRVSVGGG